jgi:TldD protein
LTSRSSHILSINNGEFEPTTIISEKGAGIRVINKGSLGFASTNVLSKEGIKEAISASISLSKSASRRTEKPIRMSHEIPYKERWKNLVTINPDNIPIEDKLLLLKDLDKTVSSLGCTKRIFGLKETEESKLLITTDESKIYGDITSISFTGFLTVISNARSTQRMIHKGETAGWECIDKWNLRKLVSDEVHILNEIVRKAKPVPTGVMDGILGSEVAGIICHEACGHPQEADRILGREAVQAGESYVTAKMLGQQIGSEVVNIIDDPTLENGFGSYIYDDEGVKARPRILIKEGRINEFLHNKQTAAHFGIKSNASARSMGYDREPIIRMANTYMKPGDYLDEELIEDIKDGIYIKSFMEWNIDDIRWNQRYVGLDSYHIVNGEIKERVMNPILDITTKKLFSSIDAVSKDLTFEAATCGKGDPMQGAPVWHGGPHIRVRGIKITKR